MLACPQHPEREAYGKSGECLLCLLREVTAQDGGGAEAPKGRPAEPGDCTPEVSAYDLFLVELSQVRSLCPAR